MAFDWRRKGRRTRQPKHVCAVDIGTTKVCALIGHVDDKGALSVLGFGSCRSPGLNLGNIKDIEQTAEAVAKAAAQAEDLAQVSARDVVAGIAGNHIQSASVEQTIEIPHRQRGIDERDRERAIKKARNALAVPEDKEIIHVTPQHFIVDGKSQVLNPIGLSSSVLGVRLHFILAAETAVRNVMRCLRKAGLRPRELVFESLASAMSVLSRHERKMGVILLDIGGGTTDVAVFKDECLIAAGEVPLGGNAITHDVEYMWKISFHDAENLKKKAGTSLPMSKDLEEMIALPTLHPSRVPEKRRVRELATIIEARVEEILMMARRAVERETDLNDMLAGVVLTGGSAMLDGVDQVAERVFGMKCRVGFPQGLRGMSGAVSSPIYSTGVGLLAFGQEEEANPLPARARWWGKIMHGWMNAYAMEG